MHEMSNLFSGKNKKKYFNMSSADNFTQSQAEFRHFQGSKLFASILKMELL